METGSDEIRDFIQQVQGYWRATTILDGMPQLILQNRVW